MDVITPEERDNIKKRCDALIANRSVITERIAEARALGDLKENAEYHAAREQQGFIEGRNSTDSSEKLPEASTAMSSKSPRPPQWAKHS